METNKSSMVKLNGTNYLFPFILITSLFFLWGFAHSMLDVLNKHFQVVMNISISKSGLLQLFFYGGYFIFAIPAGLIMNKLGYKKGIIVGLVIYALGSLLFLPSIFTQQYWMFLVSLFIIACGLTCLETAANPYSSVLGPKERAAQRINLSQSFNGLGWVLGPLIGGIIVFAEKNNEATNKSLVLAAPYLIIACIVLIVAFLFYRINLPEITEEDTTHFPSENSNSFTTQQTKNKLFNHTHFVFAVVTQFCYVAAQVGIGSLFINYVTEINTNISNQKAAILLSLGGMGVFMIGRFIGSWLLKYFKPNKMLSLYASINVILMVFVMLGLGWFSIISLFISFFFMSIMFPTIFVLGIKNLGHHTKRASSFLIMTLIGGAICPFLMGKIAEHYSLKIGFVVPLIAFVIIFLYGYKGYKEKYFK